MPAPDLSLLLRQLQQKAAIDRQLAMDRYAADQRRKQRLASAIAVGGAAAGGFAGGGAFSAGNALFGLSAGQAAGNVVAGQPINPAQLAGLAIQGYQLNEANATKAANAKAYQTILAGREAQLGSALQQASPPPEPGLPQAPATPEQQRLSGQLGALHELQKSGDLGRMSPAAMQGLLQSFRAPMRTETIDFGGQQLLVNRDPNTGAINTLATRNTEGTTIHYEQQPDGKWVQVRTDPGGVKSVAELRPGEQLDLKDKMDAADVASNITAGIQASYSPDVTPQAQLRVLQGAVPPEQLAKASPADQARYFERFKQITGTIRDAQQQKNWQAQYELLKKRTEAEVTKAKAAAKTAGLRQRQFEAEGPKNVLRQAKEDAQAAANNGTILPDQVGQQTNVNIVKYAEANAAATTDPDLRKVYLDQAREARTENVLPLVQNGLPGILAAAKEDPRFGSDEDIKAFVRAELADRYPADKFDQMKILNQVDVAASGGIPEAPPAPPPDNSTEAIPGFSDLTHGQWRGEVKIRLQEMGGKATMYDLLKDRRIQQAIGAHIRHEGVTGAEAAKLRSTLEEEVRHTVAEQRASDFESTATSLAQEADRKKWTPEVLRREVHKKASNSHRADKLLKRVRELMGANS